MSHPLRQFAMAHRTLSSHMTATAITSAGATTRRKFPADLALQRSLLYCCALVTCPNRNTLVQVANLIQLSAVQGQDNSSSGQSLHKRLYNVAAAGSRNTVSYRCRRRAEWEGLKKRRPLLLAEVMLRQTPPRVDDFRDCVEQYEGDEERTDAYNRALGRLKLEQASSGNSASRCPCQDGWWVRGYCEFCIVQAGSNAVH